MKTNKFTKILGVALTTVLLAALAIGTAVAPVSGATLAWSELTLPSATGNVITVGTSLTHIAVSPDGGTLFAASPVPAPTLNTVFFSTDGGSTWTAATTPPPDPVTAIAVSPAYATDSTVYAAAGEPGILYKSTDGGVTYTQTAAVLPTNEVITSIALSPNYAVDGLLVVGTTHSGAGTYGDVYILGAPGTFGLTPMNVSNSEAIELVITTNLLGGAGTDVFTITYVNQSGVTGQTGTVGVPATSLAGSGPYPITLAIGDIGVLDVTGVTYVGTDTSGVVDIRSVTTATVFGTGTISAVNTIGYVDAATTVGAGADVTAVAFSPSYPSDRTILAVGSDAGVTGTVLHNNVNWTQAVPTAWDQSWLAATIDANIKDVGHVTTATTGAIASSSLVLPSDYDGLNTAKRVAYVATASQLGTDTNTPVDDVYRVSGATAGVALNPTAAADDAMASLAYSGTVAAGTLFAGDFAAAQVYRSSNAPTALAGLGTWLPATLAPTGDAAPTQVALAPDFATSSKVYTGTQGAESAFSVSDDGGVNFYQTGLIRTVIDTVADVTPSPAYGTDLTIFLVTDDAAGPGSLWKTTNGGTNWIRVLTLALTNNTGIVRLSPDYAIDGTVVFADTGATAIWKSTTAGASWTSLISISTIADVLVADSSVTYVASAANGMVQKNIAGAWHWGASATPAGSTALNSLAMAANGDILVGNLIGQVYRSIDGGMIYTAIGAVIGAATVVLAIDSDYASNGIIYAGDSGGTDRGIFRIDASAATTSTTWTLLDVDAAAGTQPDGVSGIAVSSDGTLYAADPTAAGVGPPAETGGIVRSLNPTAGTTTAPTAVFEWVSTGTADALPLLYTLQSLKMAPGSNILFAVENSGAADRVMIYTDTLTGVPTLSSPTGLTQITTTTTAALSWAALTGSTDYEIDVNTASDFTGTAATITYTAGEITATGTPLTSGATYYWRVRAIAPVLSNWSATESFILALTPPGGAEVLIVVPAPGATGVSLTPTIAWPVVAGATYEFVIGEDPTFAIISYGATSADIAYEVTEPLSYSTTYFWRVRAVTGTSQSAWTTSSFTTMAEPAETLPPVIIEETELPDIIVEQPDVVVNVPAPEVTEAIPSYLLWIIIGIGAVLFISLIVLIVRTRRVA